MMMVLEEGNTTVCAVLCLHSEVAIIQKISKTNSILVDKDKIRYLYELKDKVGLFFRTIKDHKDPGKYLKSQIIHVTKLG